MAQTSEVSTIALAGQIAPELNRGGHAPDQRTLVDILIDSATRYPEAVALDDGTNELSYAELLAAVDKSADRLRELGIGRGDRVGIRIPSGTAELYVWILASLTAGTAYVPVDFEDPDERAALVFGEAHVAAVIGADSAIELRGPVWEKRSDDAVPAPRPTPADDAWIIFTSGSTGTPKGVAVTHRSAAAFVDAEARMFLQKPETDPLGPEDRVLAGLSVAFDASCEEMWLAWRHGAALVPAPRSLVRTGVDLGPWLVAQNITVVSTVPTLAALWPPHALDAVRLLIFGGEACPPELAERLVRADREVWNTYGPTEATVVACGAELTGQAPVRIGLPLDGWDLAVVDAAGNQVRSGESGELIIGGVGLARYLDPAKDAEKYAPMPELGWARAYRSGDLVRYEPAGLVFLGRADEQIKFGGRRIELGEIDAAILSLPGVSGAAAAIRTTVAGNQILVGYVVIDPGVDFVLADAVGALRTMLPATMVPMLAIVDTLPTRTSGKVDRDSLPWPLTSAMDEPELDADLSPTAAWVAQQWRNILGAAVSGADDDFFVHGGGSLTAARVVSVLRERFPEVTVADVYAKPRLGALAEALDAMVPAMAATVRVVRPTPLRAQIIQTALTVPLAVITGVRWLTWLLLLNNVLGLFGTFGWAPTVSWWWLLLVVVIFISPPGVIGVTVLGVRVLLRGVRPGVYPRGGSAHLRIWTAERLARAMSANSLAGAPWVGYYARGLGVKVGPNTDLHSLPPITGMLRLGAGCSISSEVDLNGYWLDGDQLHVGMIVVGPGATVGSRSTLSPGAVIGANAQVSAGSAVSGSIPPSERWAGSPAVRIGKAKRLWPAERPPFGRAWVVVYGLGAILLAALPLIAALPGLALLGWWTSGARTLGEVSRTAFLAVPVFTVLTLAVFIALTALCVRLLGVGLTEGFHPLRSRIGFQVWATEKLMDAARTIAYPLYASMLTPVWLRVLGAKVGRGVEASTVIMLPKMTTVGSGAFLADDTMIGSYELGGGWLRIERSKVGKRAFLGNSGMAAPGRRVPKNGLVAVLSAAPANAKAGTSWLGSPPVELRRNVSTGDSVRTYDPPLRLKVARGLVEICRLIPVMLTVAIALGTLLTLEWLIREYGLIAAGLLSGVLLLIGGALAGLISVVAKWALVGRLRVVEHPLWSSFVWRNELADTFIEMIAVPWLVDAVPGTPVLNMWLRALGSKIGRGVWLETYWLPEADLVTVGDGATVNRGCVLQTHLFHDRIMSMDTVTLAAGATMGPQGVILPAARIGENATVGPASLVMRGEAVPAGSRWIGNPIASWALPKPMP